MLNFFNVLSILSLCTSICCRMGTEKRPRLENYIYKDLLTKENINIDGIQSVWNMEYWRGMARDEVRHVLKNQKIKGPASLKLRWLNLCRGQWRILERSEVGLWFTLQLGHFSVSSVKKGSGKTTSRDSSQETVASNRWNRMVGLTKVAEIDVGMDVSSGNGYPSKQIWKILRRQN